MKVKRLFLVVFVSILILGMTFSSVAALNTPLGQTLAQIPPEATGSRSGTTDNTPPVDYVSPADFSEGFEDITILPEWYFQNNSDPLGVIDWFQGNDTVFPAQAGTPTSYIAANYNNTAGVGTISNWLLTPEQTLSNGSSISFWTRTATDSLWPDRLQVRLSLLGPSTNVGTEAEDVGDFTTLLIDINPTLAVGGYPEEWTQYTVTLSGIPGGSSGRLAFRYYVTDAGPSGNNSNYIGIDTVEYTYVPENPPSITLSKTVGIVPGVCATTDAITVTVGTQVYYCYQATNTGEITLNLHDLVDSELGLILNDLPYALAPGASSPQVIVPETMNATTVNTATWTAFNEVDYSYDDTIAYNFEDISGTGTPFTLTDDSMSAALPLGFSFNYYGTGYTDVYASSNGFLTVLPDQSSGCCTGQPLPTPGSPDGVIAGWWEDMNPSNGGTFHYQTLGSAPNRYFIVQVTNVPHYSDGNLVTLQYKLFEGSNYIEVHYTAAPSDGGTHSAGLENQDGTLGTQYYLGTAPLTTPEAVRYSMIGSFEEASATDTALVNVLFPEIDVTPTSLESTQLTDATVTKILTISNTGDPMTSLDWMVLESQPEGKLLGAAPSVPIPTGVTVAGSESETVGAAVPQGSLSDPSIIGLNSKPYMPTDVLYDNGPLVTHPGGGAGGADASALQTALGMGTYGFGHQLSAGNRVADDFTITDAGGWQIDTITFFAYQTGSGNTSSITAVNLQIWDGVPGDAGSTVVWGDPTTNVMVNTAWSNIYRVLDTGLTDTARPVMADTVLVDTHLEPGTYWLDWQSDGSVAFSGPWVPPISILGQTTTGNARQLTTTGWADLVDIGPQGLPFVVEGSLGGCIGDIPWVSVSPITGTLLGGESTPVEVTFDSTGLANGVYTATLCVISNDPDEGLTEVPLNMTVADPTYLAVGHLAPFAADPGTAVTITLNGAPALTNFAYGDSTGYITLPEDTYDVEVWPAGSTSPAITATVTLLPDTYYTAIAIGDGVKQPLSLLALVDDLTPPTTGNFHLRLGHLAPFASGDALADIRLQDGTPILTDVAFGDVTDFIPLAAGVYDLKITTPGGAVTLIDPLPVTFNEGDIVTAFATGDGSNQWLGVFAWPADEPGFFLPLIGKFYLPVVMR